LAAARKPRNFGSCYAIAQAGSPSFARLGPESCKSAWMRERQKLETARNEVCARRPPSRCRSMLHVADHDHSSVSSNFALSVSLTAASASAANADPTVPVGTAMSRRFQMITTDTEEGARCSCWAATTSAPPRKAGQQFSAAIEPLSFSTPEPEHASPAPLRSANASTSFQTTLKATAKLLSAPTAKLLSAPVRVSVMSRSSPAPAVTLAAGPCDQWQRASESRDHGQTCSWNEQHTHSTDSPRTRMHAYTVAGLAGRYNPPQATPLDHRKTKKPPRHSMPQARPNVRVGGAVIAEQCLSGRPTWRPCCCQQTRQRPRHRRLWQPPSRTAPHHTSETAEAPLRTVTVRQQPQSWAAGAKRRS